MSYLMFNINGDENQQKNLYRFGNITINGDKMVIMQSPFVCEIPNGSVEIQYDHNGYFLKKESYAGLKENSYIQIDPKIVDSRIIGAPDIQAYNDVDWEIMCKVQELARDVKKMLKESIYSAENYLARLVDDIKNKGYAVQSLNGFIEEAKKIIRSTDTRCQNAGLKFLDWFNSGEGKKILNGNNKTTSSGGCYVATCVYGSYDCPQVWTLRRYRDEALGSTWYGRLFIRLYYAISPTLVKWFGKTKWFKKLWRARLDKMVQKLQNKGFEDTPYDDREW